MYDVDGNGVIEPEEITKIVNSIYAMMGPNQAVMDQTRVLKRGGEHLQEDGQQYWWKGGDEGVCEMLLGWPEVDRSSYTFALFSNNLYNIVVKQLFTMKFCLTSL